VGLSMGFVAAALSLHQPLLVPFLVIAQHPSCVGAGAQPFPPACHRMCAR
jgi:hypothetical protein